MSKFFQIIKPASSGGSSEAWEYLDPTSPTGSADPNSLVSGLSFNSETGVISLTLDKNKGAAYHKPAEAAVYWFELDATAADGFIPQFVITPNNFGVMDNTDVVIYAGLTSDPTALATYAVAGGIDYSSPNARLCEYIQNNNPGYASGLSTTEGAAIFLQRWGSSNAAAGNIASNAIGVGIDSGGEAENIFLSNSASGVNANASTDTLYLFIGVGFTVAAAATVDMEFSVKRAPIILFS